MKCTFDLNIDGKKIVKASLLAFFVSLAFGPGAAFAADEAPKWGAHIDFEGKAGTERNLTEADIFIPLKQDDNTLLFTNLRVRKDNQSSTEGNFGLGVRQMLDGGWNVGTYAYFDRRRTRFDNMFNQVTVGAELLGKDWDFRANKYEIVGNSSGEVGGFGGTVFSGGNFVVSAGGEEALDGYDAEIGYRVPVFDMDSGTNFRVYAGGYHFSTNAPGVDDVEGPRARAELSFNKLPLWQGARLTLGAEWQYDKPRGEQAFVSARIRIPLGNFTGNKTRQNLTYQEQRMTAPIVRDVDIVSQAGVFAAPEIATLTEDGDPLTVIDTSAIANTADFNTAISGAGANSTILLVGGFNATGNVFLSGGQTLIGSGSINVKTASGLSGVASLTGREGSITFAADTSINGFVANANNRITGLTIENTRTGGASAVAITTTTRAGVIVENNTLIATNHTGGAIGIVGTSSTNNIFRNNDISVTSNNANVIGLNVQGATNLTVANNDFEFDTTTGSTFVISSSNATSYNTADSTGNTTTGGACVSGGGPPTGSVAFTTITCP